MTIMESLSRGVVAAALAISSLPVFASTWAEAGDAGELLGTADVTTGASPLTSITGFLADLSPANPADDVDMYKIHIPDPSSFSASVTTDLSALFDDVSLFLFNSGGEEVTRADNTLFNDPLGSFVGVGGDYYLAISLYATNPQFTGTPEVLLTWNRNPQPLATGSYTLTLAGTEFAEADTSTIPVPAAAWLFGSGLLGLLGMARRRNA